VLKQPQSRRFAWFGDVSWARSVWTACGSPPLSAGSKFEFSVKTVQLLTKLLREELEKL
jgi:hypothetical protein